MLEAVHIIQQAYYNFVLRRRVASLAPYTLPDKGPLQKNLRMQSVRPTLATESSTADEPPLLRETKLREHTSEDEKPQLPFITRRLSAAIAQLRVRLAAASSLGHTDTYTQTAQRTSGPTGTEHTGKVAAGQMRGGKVASRASAKRRRACNETGSWSDSDVDQSGADDDC